MRKKKIVSYLKNISQDNNKIKNFFGSLQLIIFYLTNNNFKADEEIKEILKEPPEYLKINNNCSSFFNQGDNNFKANQIMNIFFYFEHLCFDDLTKTLQQEYKAKINKETENKIKVQLLANPLKEDKLFIKDLSAALRRFISRYLAGMSQTTDINENTPLEYQLIRNDLWEEKYGKMNNLDELISKKISSFNLKVGQGFEFYNLIGEEDKKEIQEMIVKDDYDDNKVIKENNIDQLKEEKKKEMKILKDFGIIKSKNKNLKFNIFEENDNENEIDIENQNNLDNSSDLEDLNEEDEDFHI